MLSLRSHLFILLTLPTFARFGEAPYSLTLESESLSPETGEEISVFSTKLRASVPFHISESHIVAATGSYERFMYEDSAFLPFNTLTEAGVGIFTLSTLQNNWRVMSITNLRASMAEGVNPDDALTFSGIYGAWYSGWKNLTIGPGIGVATQLDDATSFFPLILIDWEFSKDWHLSTRPTPGTRFGPGVSVLYQPDSNWAFYTGARYISKDFQLDNDEIYEYKSTRVFTTIQYGITENLTLSGTVGMNVGGEVELQGTSTDLDSSFFGGVDLSWNF